MRLILKLFAAPFALALTLLIALCNFVLFATGKVLGAVSGIVFILSVALMITGQTTSGVALAIVAFLMSPFGLPAFAEWLVGILDGTGCTLKEFIFS